MSHWRQVRLHYVVDLKLRGVHEHEIARANRNDKLSLTSTSIFREVYRAP
jgi:hypothetical protein